MSRTSSLVAGLLSGAQRLRGKASGPSVDADAQIPKVRNGNEATDEELAAYLDSWEERNRDKPAAADEDPRAEHTVGQSESESQSQRQRQSQRQSQRQRHSESQSLASTQVFMRSSSTRSTLREVKDGMTGQDLVLLVIVAVVLAYGLAKPGQDEAKKGFLGTEVATAAPRPAKAREPLSEDEVRQRIQDRDSFQNAESEIFGQTDLARASERLDDPDLQIRRQAVRTLASAGAIAADSVAASVTDVELWRVAEEGLARIASDDADLVLRVLQDRLEEVVEPGPRERVILAMAVCGGRAVPVLARLAASGASQVDRRAAVRALGATFDAAATPHLTQLLDGDDLELRVLAATSLGNLSRLDAAEALLPALEDREERIRKAVHRALMRLTGERFVASPSEWTRWWLQVGQPAARSVPEVQAAYPGTRGEERIRLLRPVAEFPDVRVTEMLRNSVHHRDHGVRRFAVCALAHHPIDRVGPDLIVALSDPIDAVQADALKALHALTGRDYADEAGWRAWWDGR
jgi:HEAT repeat protein